MSSKRIDPYWLVAIPQEYKGHNPIGLQKLKEAIRPAYGKVLNFNIPGNLKIGTLDSLMAITESLGKVDQLVAMTLSKVSKTLEELQGKPAELGVEGKTPSRYVETFQWSSVKYKTSSSLKAISHGIESDVRKYETDIKKLVLTHNEVSATLETIDRTDNGTLLVRPLGPIIKKIDIYPSASLETIFVVFQAKTKSSFLQTYETMEHAYKERVEKKRKDDLDSKKELDRADAKKLIPELLKDLSDPQKRAGLLQGGSVYKHIADLLRKAAFAQVGEADALAQCKEALAEALEIKLTPYEAQKPNTSGAKRAVLDCVLTAEEFGVESKRVTMCKKMVEQGYLKAQAQIQRHNKETKRADRKKIVPQFVVPGSAKLIQEDGDYCLYSLIILKKFKTEVLKICREKRITVRQYKYDAEGEKKHYKKKMELKAEKTKNFKHAQLKCRHLYPEIFVGWMHIKAVRCFAESILRFGLPERSEDFKAIFPKHIQAALVVPQPGQEERVRSVMYKLYGKLASEEVMSQLGTNETDYSGFGADFYPYVYLPIDLNHN